MTVYGRISRRNAAVGDSFKNESGKEFVFDPKYGYIYLCPINLGTGMRVSVHVDYPWFKKKALIV